MKLEYFSTIDDLADPQIRLYLRSKSYAQHKLRAALIGAVSTTATVYIISLIRENAVAWWIYLIAFLLGYTWTYISFKSSMIKGMRKNIARDVGHLVPSETKYVVEHGELKCSSLGVQFTFLLSQLTEINEELERLELVFGEAGLCLIPLRVFEDESHKSSFLECLKAID